MAYPAGQRATTPTTCSGCGVVFLPNPSRTQRYCTATCGRHARQRAEQANRPPSAARRCACCGVTFIPAPRHPRTRHCSPRCASRARAGAVKVISHGFARLARAGAGRRDRLLRCSTCQSSLGFSTGARILVIERRVVIQLVDGRMKLAAECQGCGELKAVVQVPAARSRPAPSGIAAVATG